MNIPKLAIRHYQFTSVIIFLMLALGIASFMSMPRSEDPQFDFPMTMTTIVYPGTSPIDIEKLVVDPVESAINELEDIKSIETTIEDGMALIKTEFLFGSDANEKYDDVVAAINAISATLPADIRQITTDKISPADTNILQIGLLSATASYAELSYWLDKLEQRLERVEGVKRVDLSAMPEQEVQIKLDLPRISGLGISIDQINQLIQSSAANIPGGHVDSEGRRFTVKTSGDFTSLEQIRNLIVRASDHSALYLKDIASVELADELPRHHALLDNKKVVFAAVVQRKGSNIFNVTDGVKAELAAFNQSLQKNIESRIIFDQSRSVEKRVDGFFENLLQGLALVGLLTLAILGMRAAIVVITAIPLSIAIGLGWLDMAGFGLQQMSVAGLIIALGLLVDNAIVVTENVGRYLRAGYSKSHAAIKGASEVSWAVISGTLTTILAFFPILLLPTGSGTFMRSMPVTVILTLIASLIIAIALTPMLASKFLKTPTTNTGDEEKDKATALNTPETSGNMIVRAFDRFTDGPYQKTIALALDYPKTLMTIAVLILVSSLSLMGAVGVSLFPKAEKPMVLVNIQTTEGTSFSSAKNIAMLLAGQIGNFKEVASVTTNVGKANPRIYYNTSAKREAPSFAQLLVQVQTHTYQQTEELVKTLRQQYEQFPGAKITIQEFMQGPPYAAPIAIRVNGEELELLRKVSLDIEKIINETDGTVSVDNPVARHKVDMIVDINREKAAMVGLSLEQIDQSVRAGLVGIQVGKYIDVIGEEHPIIIRQNSVTYPDWSAFDTLSLRSQSGAMIPLTHVVDMHMQSEIPTFQHRNLERMVQVTADVLPGFQTEAVTNAIVAKLDQYPWPAGVSYNVGGEQENRKESFSGMNQALITALLGIFAILVMQFRSFKQPLIIFAAIPFAMTGAILALWVSGYTFSFTAFIGLTSLVGIVVNNSIILVDYANQLRLDAFQRNTLMPVKDAITLSAKTRLLPIVLTTLTTIGGLLPLTLSGSSMWSPMGWAIIGGLAFSTILTLLVVPVLYLWLTSDDQACSLANEEDEDIPSLSPVH
ncbi:MAG: efflux RND transporter permease subunit [Hahellaceae bacterium]|nr:efflux RND transporter permease subunit [Hahellaceae bacterium]MCP5210906.1 efflux RND transporter permease subunit [Hahellaceae bacterium]